MIALNPNHPFYAFVVRDFERWAKEQSLIHKAGMVGQSESHFPCKTAYAVAIYDHDKGRFTHIRVMLGYKDWRVIEV